jgi:hypothetical protein
MSTIKVLKANKLQIAINNYTIVDFVLITNFNAAVKDNKVDEYMEKFGFRNIKVMEIALENARVKVLRWYKIMNSISKKYNTVYCDNDIFVDVCKALDENL